MVALSPVLLRFSVFFIGFTGDEKNGNDLFGYDIPQDARSGKSKSFFFLSRIPYFFLGLFCA